jgi:hypothetical protein
VLAALDSGDRTSEAGRFDVVAQLARELEARRRGSLVNVIAWSVREPM